MTGIFDEKNMKERLEKHIPEGETLLAGIHCVNKEPHIFRYYQNSVPHEDKVYQLDDAEPKVLQVVKSKYSTDDLYIGITQNHFVFATCLDCKYLYEFDYVKDDAAYELTDIEKCEFKKGCWAR